MMNIIKTLLPYFYIIILISLSAFFSGSEIAYAGANSRRLKKDAENGNKKSELALKIINNYDKALPAILIGNNLVNIASSSLATVIAISVMDDGIGTAVATVIMTVIILIFGEILPKILAKNNNISFSKNVAYPLQVIIWLFTPIVFIVSFTVKMISKLWKSDESSDTMTEDELLTIIETIEDEGVIDEEKSELLQSAIEFDDITVHEILTPRVDMTAIDINDDFQKNVEILLECKYSRIPVYEDSVDNIIGILPLNTFLKEYVDNNGHINIKSLLIETCFFPKSMKLGTVLSEFKAKQCHIAIVTDEFGGTMGIVTLEDVLEEIMGDIWDEKDVVTNEVSEVKNNVFEINGDMAIFDFCDYFDIDEDSVDSEYVTVGGLAIEMLEGYPKVGDEFEFKNLTLNVRQVSEKRVKKLYVTINPENDKENDED